MSPKRISLMVASCAALIFASCSKNNIQPETNNEKKSAQVVPGRFIIVLNEDHAAIGRSSNDVSFEDGKEIAQEHAASVFEDAHIERSSIRESFGTLFQGVVADISDEQAKALAKDPRVKFIEKDKYVSIPGLVSASGKNTGTITTPKEAQTTPWGIQRVGGAGNGVGKTAWVLDSGIDFAHTDLNGDTRRSKSFVDGIRKANDDNGHGTHVAGIIAAKDDGYGTVGVAAGATVVALKVLNSNGDGMTSWVIAALDYVAANAAINDIVNLSLSSGTSYAMDDAIRRTADKGIRIVVAAGNNAADVMSFSPSRVSHPNVYPISAIGQGDYFSWYSNFGSTVRYAAPGNDINSTFLNGTYKVMSGTSMAAPHAAGVLLMGNPKTSGFALNDRDNVPDPIISR